MTKNTIKIQKTNKDALVPEYKTDGAAGFDLASIENAIILPNYVDDEGILAFAPVVVSTGLAFDIPEGYEMEIRGRSGLAFNHDIMAFNGTIDSDYTGTVKIKLYNLSNKTFHIKKGDRVAQGILKKVEQFDFKQVNELKTTERGANGFGSTGGTN
jgi:dUTP pyrophosphatase